ncbi:MAG TPA: phage major capsid protein [Microthrixaceae bacterium]|nr:phage major capsid protein [Microthrixaceae bacterium]
MDLLTITRGKIAALLEARAVAEAELDAILAPAVAEERDLNESENEARTAAVAKIMDLDEKRTEAEAREAELVAEAEARAAADETAKRLDAAKPAEVRGQAIVTRSEPVYRPDGDHSFFGDAYAARYGYAPDAQDRLYRNSLLAKESRDVGTSAFGALVVPQYLTEMFAPNLAAGRAFSNTVQGLSLPSEGMTINIPRGTTATGVAVQSAEADPVQETDFDETTLAVSVKTYAGQQDISRQAVERGRGVDQIIYADLAAQYAVALNTANITATLAVSGIGSVAYTDASPTVAELFPKLANAVQTVNSGRYMPASVIFMHPRRWGWMTAALDANSRPLISTDVPDNTIGLGKAAGYGQVVGQILGVPVVSDACISTGLGAGTNEDAIIVAKADDILLWEDSIAPTELRFEEVGGDTLQVKLVVYGYSAFTAGRYPTAICKVTGTGLVTPTF